MTSGKKLPLIPAITLSLALAVSLLLSSCNYRLWQYPFGSPPPFDTSLLAEGISSSEINLSWTMPVEEPDTRVFQVYRDNVLIASTASHFYTDTGLATESAHEYYVIASDGTAELLRTVTVTAAAYPAGNTFYIDPASGSMSNSGSSGSPWHTLQEVIEAGFIEMKAYATPYEEGADMITVNGGAHIQGGDTLILRSGYHGEIYLRSACNERFITIKAQAGHTPTVSRVTFLAASRWRLNGVTITQEAAPVYERSTLVSVASGNWHGPTDHIIVENCDIYSINDASSWSAEQWDTLSCNGIGCTGEESRFLNNTLRNCNFAISIDGKRNLVRGNRVINFAGDGMRGNGHDLVFEYNTVKNCYAVNLNHDDGFQSFSVNGAPPWERVVLRGNIIINRDDPAQPLQGSLQGIGCFDGFYIDWIIENNVVVVDHWHGISLYGALNCRVMNNTVINPYSDRDTWILINPHKDGRPSADCLVRNNITENIIITTGASEDHNYILERNFNLFENAGGFIFSLAADAASLIDTGSPDMAPLYDIEESARPSGNGVDIGAYER
jgi:parallel beta-helix repeat protein